MIIVCVFCKEEVSTSPTSGNYRQIVGWEQVRRGGGAHGVTLRREVGRWAHRGCLDAYGRGYGEQGNLL